MLPGVTWTIAGRPVPIQDFSAGAEANLGYGQMRGVLRASDARSLPTTVKQGAIIRGSTDNGRIFYQGRISGPPRIQRGLAVIAAQGEGMRAVKRATRLFYQTRDLSSLTERIAPPFGNTTDNPEALNMTIGPGSLLWSENVGRPTGGNVERGAVWWSPGMTVSRYAFSWKIFFGTASYQVVSHWGNGDGDSGYTSIATHVLSAGTGTVDNGTGNLGDRFMLHLEWTGGAVTFGGNHVLLTDVRLNGIAPGDTYTGSQVIADVGSRLGYDISGIPTTSLNILPLDWTQGSWADLMTYIANAEDRVWGVWEDNRLTYEQWGAKQWTAYQAWGAQVDLTELEVWNGVTVKYKDVGGAGQDGRPPREVTVMADPDPLAGTDQINIWTVELADVQPDDVVPTAVANILLPQVSSVRYVGRVETPHLFDSVGRDLPFEAKPGATLRVPDFTEGAMRIASIDYTRTGVSIGIEASASAFPTIRGAELERLRMPGDATLPGLEHVPGVTEEDLQHGFRQQWLDRFEWAKAHPKRGAKYR